MDLLRKAENLTEAHALLDPNRPLEGRWSDKSNPPEPRLSLDEGESRT